MSEPLTGQPLEEFIRTLAVELARDLLQEALHQADFDCIPSDMQMSIKASILLTACQHLVAMYREVERKVESGEYSDEDLDNLVQQMKEEKKEWN